MMAGRGAHGHTCGGLQAVKSPGRRSASDERGERMLQAEFGTTGRAAAF